MIRHETELNNIRVHVEDKGLHRYDPQEFKPEQTFFEHGFEDITFVIEVRKPDDFFNLQMNEEDSKLND